MVRFICPGCNGMFQVADEHIGKVVRCPMCRETLDTSLGQAQAGATAMPQATLSPPGLPDASSPAAPNQPTMPSGPYSTWPGYAAGPVMPRQPNPHGLVSFLIGVAGWLLYFFGLGPLAGKSMPEGFEGKVFDFQQAWAMVEALRRNPAVSILLGVIAALSLAGAILGIYALTRPMRKRGLAIAGLIICALNSLCCGSMAFLYMPRG